MVTSIAKPSPSGRIVTRAINISAVAGRLTAMLDCDMEDKSNAYDVLHRCLHPGRPENLSIHSFCRQLFQAHTTKMGGIGSCRRHAVVRDDAMLC